MKLSDYGESLAYDVAFWTLGLENPDYPAEKLGTLSLELSAKLRALSIITLLVKAESDFFFHNLIRSGNAREIYLRRVAAAGLLEDHHRSLGRFEPVLDLLAAGAFDRIERIRALSPESYRPGHEYEDDHLYAALLHELSAESPREDRLPELLDRLEGALDGLPQERLDVLRALAGRSQEAFDAGFQALLQRHTAEIEADRKRGVLDDPATVAGRQVFIEGLAILRLADRRGLSTESEYPYCPSLARVPMQVPFPEG